MTPLNPEEFLTEKTKHQQKYLPDYKMKLRHLTSLLKENEIVPIFVTQPALYGNFTDNITGLNFENTAYQWGILELYKICIILFLK